MFIFWESRTFTQTKSLLIQTECVREITVTNIYRETNARMSMQFMKKEEDYYSDKKDEKPYLSSRNIGAHILHIRYVM